MAHILERFLIHLISATFLTLAAFYLLRYWGRHNRKVQLFISGRHAHLVTISALVVFAISVLREPVDIHMGQVWYKAITDQISWFSGCAVAAWGLYRFKKIEE